MPVTIPAEEIPEHLVSALEMHECRDNDAFATGAAYGTMTYGAALMVLTFLPAAWLNWKLQGSWKYGPEDGCIGSDTAPRFQSAQVIGVQVVPNHLGLLSRNCVRLDRPTRIARSTPCVHENIDTMKEW